MSKNNGHLVVNPKSNKSYLNAGQSTHSLHHQPTYIIIYKQKESPDHDNKSNTTETKNAADDIVRKNLTDIDVDNYDSSFSTAKIFLDDEDNNLLREPITRSRRKTKKCFESTDSSLIKKKLFESRVSPITSTYSAVTSAYSAVTSSVTPGSNDEHDSGIFCTPTSGESLKNHAAVRKIVLISPDVQTDLKGQLTTHTLQSCSTSSPQFSPGFSIPRFPLAASTPITSIDDQCNIDNIDTPDSAISMTSSFTCTPETPFGTSTVNLSTTSTSSVSSAIGHLQVSEKVSNSGQSDCEISQNDLKAIGTPDSTKEEQEDESLDTSLANIHWLKGYTLPKRKPATKSSSSQGGASRRMSESRRAQLDLGDSKRADQDMGQSQRPPYSYMTLIQMALCSRDDKKMTLKEICSWVESTFPFYKYTAKPGWKNSIRHNLSFYQCFVRDQAEKKKHGAHWTLQFDESEHERAAASKSSGVPLSQTMTANEVPGMIPLFVNSPFLQSSGSLQSFQSDPSSSRKRRSGPMPILPRPSPMQAYALVPIQSVPLQAMQNNPIIVHVPNSMPQQQVMCNLNPLTTSLHSNPQHTQAITVASSINSVHSSSCHSQSRGMSSLPQQQVNSVYTQQSQNMTTITVNPSECSVETSTTNYSKLQLSSMPLCMKDERTELESTNVIKQAWLQAGELACENQALVLQGLSPHMYSCDSMLDPLPEVHSEDGEQKNKRQKTNAGLPKPKMYASHPKKKTRSRVKKQLPKVSEEKELLADSSDSESENKIFNGLPTPLRLLFDSENPSSEPRITSTPLRNVSFSPEQLPSPIRGLTPLKCGNLFDGSFLDNLQEEATRTIKLFGSPINNDVLKTGNSLFSEYGIVQISPDRGMKEQNDSDNKHSLSNLLADFPIDANFMDDGDGLPVDFSVLNWSNLQQQCLNKSGSPSDS